MKPFFTCTVKPVTLFSLFVLYVSLSFGQLTEGDIAPNFTYEDINGNSHTLYDYLDEGYSVFITMSATWCGPCWGFHQSGAKSELWANHGPAGEPGVNENTTDDLMVIFIEGDPETTTAQLNGIGGGTQGDWVTGVNYPIIDVPDESITQAYDLPGFPSAWMICPDRRISAYRVGFNPNTMSAAALYSTAEGCMVAQGDVNPALISYDGQTNLGCEGGTIDVSVTLQNLGLMPLESASFQVENESEVLLTYDWSGSLNTYELAVVELGSMELDAATLLQITITSENEYQENSTIEQEISFASEIGSDIVVNFYTDNYPSESSWEIRNAGGQVVASGGPYQAGTADQWGGGGPDANTTKTHEVTLPAAEGTECYSIRVLDSFGDGLQYGTNPAGQFGLEVFYDGNSVVNLDLGNFGSVHNAQEVMRQSVLSVEDNMRMADLNIFPNPSTGMVNIEFNLIDNQKVQIDVFDVTGKRIIANMLGNLGAGFHRSTFDLSALPSGMYIINFTTNYGTRAEKLMLSR